MAAGKLTTPDKPDRGWRISIVRAKTAYHPDSPPLSLPRTEFF